MATKVANSTQPKKKIKRLRTGCWTCRKRGYKCDEGKPACANCTRMKINCEGYDIRLKWPDDRRKSASKGATTPNSDSEPGSFDGSVPRCLANVRSPILSGLSPACWQSYPHNVVLQEIEADDSYYTPGVSRALQHVLRLEPEPVAPLIKSPQDVFLDLDEQSQVGAMQSPTPQQNAVSPNGYEMSQSPLMTFPNSEFASPALYTPPEYSTISPPLATEFQGIPGAFDEDTLQGNLDLLESRDLDLFPSDSLSFKTNADDLYAVAQVSPVPQAQADAAALPQTYAQTQTQTQTQTQNLQDSCTLSTDNDLISPPSYWLSRIMKLNPDESSVPPSPFTNTVPGGSANRTSESETAILLNYYVSRVCDDLIPMGIGYYNAYRDIVLPCTSAHPQYAMCSVAAAHMSICGDSDNSTNAALSADYFARAIDELNAHLRQSKFDFDSYITMCLLATQATMMRDPETVRYILQKADNYIGPYLGDFASLPGAPNAFEAHVLYAHFKYFDTFITMLDPRGPAMSPIKIERLPIDDTGFNTIANYFFGIVADISRLRFNLTQGCNKHQGVFCVPPVIDMPEDCVQARSELQMALGISSFSSENLTPSMFHAIMVIKLATILYFNLRLDCTKFNSHEPQGETASLVAECISHLEQVSSECGSTIVLSWPLWQLGMACDCFPQYRQIILDCLVELKRTIKFKTVQPIINFLQTYWGLFDTNPDVHPRTLMNQTAELHPLLHLV